MVSGETGIHLLPSVELEIATVVISMVPEAVAPVVTAGLVGVED
jgi:hypothetical protein